jgi:steroid delta-isomerase-like uncharacterized protein
MNAEQASTPHHDTGRELVLAWARHWTAHDVGGLMSLFTDDASYEDKAIGHTSTGRAELKAFFEATFVTFPDFKVTVAHVAANREFAAGEWEMSGTFLGGMPGLAPTGKAFRVKGCCFMRLQGERIRHHCDYWNVLTFNQQTGVASQ